MQNSSTVAGRYMPIVTHETFEVPQLHMADQVPNRFGTVNVDIYTYGSLHVFHTRLEQISRSTHLPSLPLSLSLNPTPLNAVTFLIYVRPDSPALSH
jgi:hypothetical protein